MAHCGETKRTNKMQGAATRPGLRKCYACRKQFRVTVGTVFESSHIELHQWLQAAYLICSSKKGISSNQMSRMLGVTIKTGWFVTQASHRDGDENLPLSPMGGQGRVVEIDETFIGRSGETILEDGAMPTNMQ